MSRIRPAFVAFLAVAAPAAADPLVTERIDREVATRLRAAGVVPAGRADDATLVRRIHLDLLGRPPTEAEADAFLADPGADKVHRLIERLRRYPEAPAHWRRVIAEWLQAGVGSRRGDGTAVLNYLAVALGENVAWDQIARELLDPDPNDFRRANGAEYLAGFLDSRLDEKDRKARREAAAVAVGSAFFGVQLQCARCHDHPQVPEWTKARFDGLVAVFQSMRVETKRGSRTIITDDPAARPKAAPEFLDGTRLDGKEPLRTQLVRHALRPEAPHFKRAIVNRVWKQLLGRGLVEPVDMIHPGNTPSHPVLFAFLAEDFADNGFDLDRLVSSVMHSEAYLRSARWTGPADARPAPELLAVAELRPLSGPQTAWAVTTGLGTTEAMKARPRRFPAPVPGLDPEARYGWEGSIAFDRLVGAFRSPASGPPTTPGHAIHLAFDPTVLGLLDDRGALPAQLAEEEDDEKVARRAYLAVLSRRPTPDEVAVVRGHLKAAKTRRDGCRDLVWALLAGAEFRFNH
jgi:hypothetical protein